MCQHYKEFESLEYMKHYKPDEVRDGYSRRFSAVADDKCSVSAGSCRNKSRSPHPSFVSTNSIGHQFYWRFWLVFGRNEWTGCRFAELRESRRRKKGNHMFTADKKAEECAAAYIYPQRRPMISQELYLVCSRVWKSAKLLDVISVWRLNQASSVLPALSAASSCFFCFCCSVK